MAAVEENYKTTIGRVGHPKGSGQFTVQVPCSVVAHGGTGITDILVQLGKSMSSSRKTKTWVKRGSYCYLSLFNDPKTKVMAEMTQVISSAEEKSLRKSDIWCVFGEYVFTSLIEYTGQKSSL